MHTAPHIAMRRVLHEQTMYRLHQATSKMLYTQSMLVSRLRQAMGKILCSHSMCRMHQGISEGMHRQPVAVCGMHQALHEERGSQLVSL